MIHPNQIKRRADEDGLTAASVERDYVLAHVIEVVADHDLRADANGRRQDMAVLRVIGHRRFDR